IAVSVTVKTLAGAPRAGTVARTWYTQIHTQAFNILYSSPGPGARRSLSSGLQIATSVSTAPSLRAVLGKVFPLPERPSGECSGGPGTRVRPSVHGPVAADELCRKHLCDRDTYDSGLHAVSRSPCDRASPEGCEQ